MMLALGDHQPEMDASCYLADSAELIGQVHLAAHVSVWPQAVLRGDIESIHIGSGSNIQDGSVLHTSKAAPCVVGERVTIGHRVILHGCRIDDECLIGMGAIIMDHAHIKTQCVIAAGALVSESKVLESGMLYAGVPARAIRPLRDSELAFLQQSAKNYQGLAARYASDARLIT